jgi:hypothetical protein
VAAGSAGVFLVGIRASAQSAPGTPAAPDTAPGTHDPDTASFSAAFFRRVPAPGAAWRITLLDDATMVVFGDSDVPAKIPTGLQETFAGASAPPAPFCDTARVEIMMCDT